MFLGIDLGTSGVKAIVIDADGAIVAQHLAALTVSRPTEAWSEQDPRDWWRAVDLAVRAIDPALRTKVQAIGLAGQMHGATLLGADDSPLRPAILWNDGRSFAECEELERLVPASREITGNLAMPGFTAPKLLWVRRHEPQVFERVRSVLLPKDFVRLQLTGDKASDMSDSAGTLWLDVAERDWSDAMLVACGLERANMPALYEGTEVTGVLRADVAQAWGMARVPVAAGGGDNAAGAAGIGVVADGDALLSLGTSGVIFVATDRLRANPARAAHAFCHCLPRMWHQMAVHLSAASCADWGARQLGLADTAAFFALAECGVRGSGGAIFLPYLSGERTPHNDPRVRAGFVNLDNDTSPADLACAVLEGVAFALADGLDVLREAGSSVDSLSVIGGGARSRFWGEILAAALDVPLVYRSGGEVGPALGAAKLAQIAVTGALAGEVLGKPAIVGTIEPNPMLVNRLAPKRQRFMAAYPALSSI